MSTIPKLIAFYLPQYHPIPENNKWWGKGFTEWTNVTKAKPVYTNHYQPHLPSELGFYDLRLETVLEEQVSLAKQYGIYGFCYYFYWFKGKRLLDMPLTRLLENNRPNFPFCLCWANENWTRRWDGAEQEVLIKQEYSVEDDIAFINTIIPYLKDPRYIKIDGKPLLLIYRVTLLPDPIATFKRWRQACQDAGIPAIHISIVQSFNIQDPRPFEADSALEFPPHGNAWIPSTEKIELIHPDFRGNLCDYLGAIKFSLQKKSPQYPLFRGIMVGFDNTARRQNAPDIFINSSPEAYELWLENILRMEAKKKSSDNFVFINAWNEWAEGNHLEPDDRYGRGFLEATARAKMHSAFPALRDPLAEIKELPKEFSADTLYHQTSLLKHKPDSSFKKLFVLLQIIRNQGGFMITIKKILSTIKNKRLFSPRAIANYGKMVLQRSGHQFNTSLKFNSVFKKLFALLQIVRNQGGFMITLKKTLKIIKNKHLFSPRDITNYGKIVLRRSGHQFNTSLKYETWHKKQLIDRCTLAFRDAQFMHDYNIGPKISVIMPVCDPHPIYLRKAIDSVLSQYYQNWELCIADDYSINKSVKDILHVYENGDPRIKIVLRAERGHISKALNSAAELATGDYLAFLDHDDELEQDALYWVAKTTLENPKAKLIYSDEDRINTKGILEKPYFKPDWNKDLLLSQNYICHLLILSKPLFTSLGGFRSQYDGSQDYDIVLRASEQCDENEIKHIPLVLYHWREHSGSTSIGIDAKPYALQAGLQAVTDHLQRLNINATVIPDPFKRSPWNKINYTLPEKLPLVSIIIPTRNRHDLLKKCIDSIQQLTNYKNFEIIVIDNGTDNPASIRYLNKISTEQRIKILKLDIPFNYARLNNEAVKIASGEILLFMNNDIEVFTANWLDEMVSNTLRKEIGVTGACLWFPNHRLQHGGVILGIWDIASHAHYGLGRGDTGYWGRAILQQNFSAVTGACMAIRKEIFEKIGGFDASLAISLNDVDLCLRIEKLGFKNTWTPFAELIHHESATRKEDDTPEKKANTKREFSLFKARWNEIIFNDPAYNPNLTLDKCDFSLSNNPRIDKLMIPLEVSYHSKNVDPDT